MNFYLVISLIVIVCLLLLVNVYMLAYYCHPDDKGWGASLFCKLLVIIGMTLSWAQVLLLPLDVANSRGYGGGLPMKEIWYFIYIMVALLAIILIPFAMFYYETDDSDDFEERKGKIPQSRLWAAFQLTLCYSIIIILIVFIAWVFFNEADIPVRTCVVNIGQWKQSNIGLEDISTVVKHQACEDLQLTMEVSYVVFMMAMFSFVGMFFFIIFGGVGLFALPLDYIHAFTRRPKLRKPAQLREAKGQLSRKTNELIELANDVKDNKDDLSSTVGYWKKRKRKGECKQKANKLRKGFRELSKELELFKFESNISLTNPLWFFFSCILGVVFICISSLWFIHMQYILLNCNYNILDYCSLF